VTTCTSLQLQPPSPPKTPHVSLSLSCVTVFDHLHRPLQQCVSDPSFEDDVIKGAGCASSTYHPRISYDCALLLPLASPAIDASACVVASKQPTIAA